MKRIITVFALVLLANFALVLKVHAQIESEPEPVPTPIGVIVKLDFNVPGIGSESGNPAPTRPSRNVVLNFYKPDANSADASIKPLASVSTDATYDSDPASPTFGRFVNHKIDLATVVPDGRYQISFKADQALSKLVKEKEGAVGGKIFKLNRSHSQDITISNETVIIGDIYPAWEGDDIMDINDHNALINCFGPKAETINCTDKLVADLNDNGIVDGTDYNLMFNSFKALRDMGLSVPELFAQPTKRAPKPTSAAPKDAPVKKPAKSGNVFMIIIIFLVFLGAGAGIFFFLKKKKKQIAANPPDAPPAAGGADTAPETPVSEAGEEAIDKEFYVKIQTEDPENKRTVLTLTDDNGPTLGYYSGTDAKEGFAKVKGVMKKDGDKVFIDVSEITSEEESTA